jgi:DMSO reductase anchor subunit
MRLGAQPWLITAVVVAAGLQLLNLMVKFLWLVSSDTFELKATARLLSAQLRSLLLLRSALLVVGGVILPLRAHAAVGLAVALALAFCGEILGRYLFFVSVVPKNMAASYLSGRKAAA